MRLLRRGRLSYGVDSLLVLAIIAIGDLLWFLFFWEKSPLAFAIAIQHASNQQEKYLLRDVDRRALAHELRDLADRQEWKDID